MTDKPDGAEGRSAAATVNERALLTTPDPLATFTLYEPVERAGTVQVIDVSPQILTVALVVPNLTVPCAVPKFDPEIVMLMPAGPLVGDRLVNVGVVIAVTLNGSLLLLIAPVLSVTPIS